MNVRVLAVAAVAGWGCLAPVSVGSDDGGGTGAQDAGHAACTPGADQSCNDDESISALLGQCVVTAGRAGCVCTAPHVLNPATGRCGFRVGTPNVLMLFDKSGSLGLPIDSSPSTCRSCGLSSGPCPASCPTRISEVQTALGAFFSGFSTAARFSLAAYPTDSICGAGNPASVRVALPAAFVDGDAALAAQAALVNSSIQRISTKGVGDDLVGGGTPTSAALASVAGLAQLNDASRANFVLLVTDGLPNCNAANPANCTDAPACQCTLASCGTSTSATFCTLGCLDQTGTVAAIEALRQQNVRTIVLVIGPDGSPTVFNAMARAGGLERTCAADVDCGLTETCALGTCSTLYYRGTTAEEISAALAKISQLLR